MLELAERARTRAAAAVPRAAAAVPVPGGREVRREFRGEGGDWDAIDSIYRFRRPRSPSRSCTRAGSLLASAPERRGAGSRNCVGPGWQRLRRSAWASTTCGCCSTWRCTRPAGAAEGWAGGRFELWRRRHDGCARPCVRATSPCCGCAGTPPRTGRRPSARSARWEKGLRSAARRRRTGVGEPRRGDRDAGAAAARRRSCSLRTRGWPPRPWRPGGIRYGPRVVWHYRPGRWSGAPAWGRSNHGEAGGPPGIGRPPLAAALPWRVRAALAFSRKHRGR